MTEEQSPHSYTVYQDGLDTVVDLVRLADGATKQFRNTNKTTVEYMQKHMDSLTEGQIEQFFPKSRAK